MMRIRFFATTIVLAAAALSPAAARAQGEVVAGQTTLTLPDTQAYTRTARRILALERERSAAIARHDTAWLATLYAPDFRGVVANGRRVSRADLFRVFSFDNPEARFTIDELEVRDFGAAATVTGRLRTLGPGGAAAAESRYLHVYLRRGGHWWIVAAEGTVVAAP
ncbi:MAG: nuclear transport factor 2 family protein [Longimicrobiaceae bacterium]